MTPFALAFPGPFEIIILLVLLGGPIALVIFAITRGKRQQTIATGFPVAQPDGPGRYRIAGVDKNTRADRDVVIEADSRANAQVKAELDGIIVTNVSKL